jgi:hypothetical protein
VNDEINNCIEEMQRLAEAVSCERDVKATIVTGMPSTRSGKSDPTYRKAQKILDDYKAEICRIEARQRGLFEKKAYVRELVSILSPVERQLIELRYFIKYDWWMIASQMNYNKRHCYKVRDSAILKMIEYADATEK